MLAVAAAAEEEKRGTKRSKKTRNFGAGTEEQNNFRQLVILSMLIVERVISVFDKKN